MLTIDISSFKLPLAEGFPSFCEQISSRSLGHVMDVIAEYVKEHQLDTESFTVVQPITIQTQHLQQFLIHLYGRNSFYEMVHNIPQCISLPHVFNNLNKLVSQTTVSDAVNTIEEASAKFYYYYLYTFESKKNIGLTGENISNTLYLFGNTLNQRTSRRTAHLPAIAAKWQCQYQVVTAKHIELILTLLSRTSDIQKKICLFNLFESHYRQFKISSKTHIDILFLLINQEAIAPFKIKLLDALAYYLYLAKTHIVNMYPFYHQKFIFAKKLIQQQLSHLPNPNLSDNDNYTLKEQLNVADEKLSTLLEIYSTWAIQDNINHLARKLRENATSDWIPPASCTRAIYTPKRH